VTGTRQRRGGTSLMVRLVLSFLVLSVLMVAIVGFVAYARAKDSLQGTVFDRLNAAAELKTDSLDRWIDEQRHRLDAQPGGADLDRRPAELGGG
jgi:hypothetical protein